MRININGKVRVRLTEKGREIAERSMWPFREDPAGWSEWQLWILMMIFGDSLWNGCDLPFETEMEIMGDTVWNHKGDS